MTEVLLPDGVATASYPSVYQPLQWRLDPLTDTVECYIEPEEPTTFRSDHVNCGCDTTPESAEVLEAMMDYAGINRPTGTWHTR